MTAPHLIILSTSLSHAPLLRRCCRIIRASWHSVQALRTFACIAPSGRSGDCARNTVLARAMNARAAVLYFKPLCLDMDLHLVDNVVEVSAGIPLRGLRLNASLTVRRARHDDELA